METTEYLLQRRWLLVDQRTGADFGPWHDVMRRPLNLDGLKEIYHRMDDLSGGRPYEEVQHLFQIVIVPRQTWGSVRMPGVQTPPEAEVRVRETGDQTHDDHS